MDGEIGPPIVSSGERPRTSAPSHDVTFPHHVLKLQQGQVSRSRGGGVQKGYGRVVQEGL